jgi:hypothetical protein
VELFYGPDPGKRRGPAGPASTTAGGGPMQPTSPAPAAPKPESGWALGLGPGPKQPEDRQVAELAVDPATATKRPDGKDSGGYYRSRAVSGQRYEAKEAGGELLDDVGVAVEVVRFDDIGIGVQCVALLDITLGA